jgi:thiamine biosynthesis lipoprotein
MKPDSIHPLLLSTILVLSAASCATPKVPAGRQAESARPLARYEYNRQLIGVPFRIVLYAPDQATAAAAADAAFARVAELDAVLMDESPGGELARLYDGADSEDGQPVKVHDDLFHVLQQALLASRRSGGAFDVTVGPYVSLWRQARAAGRAPSSEELSATREFVGWEKVRLDAINRTVQLAPGMRLDLRGIARGYACDGALATLAGVGLGRAMVQAGDDLAAGRPPPGRKGWRVRVTGSGEDKPEQSLIPLANRGVSSAGPATPGGPAGPPHDELIDPRSGLPVVAPVVVTVTAHNAIGSDTLSTAAAVLGPQRGDQFVRSFPGALALFSVSPVGERAAESAQPQDAATAEEAVEPETAPAEDIAPGDVAP